MLLSVHSRRKSVISAVWIILTMTAVLTCVEIESPIIFHDVEAIQQHLEGLAAKHRLRGNCRNFLQQRHLRKEFAVVDVTEKNGDDELESLFVDFARTVCKADAIPRKELFEAWAMALYVHNHFPKERRIADLACGHGLLSWALIYLDDHYQMKQQGGADENLQPRSAVCIEKRMPFSVEKLQAAMTAKWPGFNGRWDYVESHLERIVASPSTLLVGVHCCAALSDRVIDLSIAANAPLALVPCCHTHKCLTQDQKKNVRSILKAQNCTLAEFIDSNRVKRLKDAGFDVQEQLIPSVITPKNRIILATPPGSQNSADPHPDAAPLLTSTTFTCTKNKYTVPIGDTPEARAAISALSGRRASTLRRRPPPPSLSISIYVPRPESVTMDNIKELAEQVVSEFPFDDVKYRDDEGKANKHLDAAAIATRMKEQVRSDVAPVRELHRCSDGGYCKTYRVTYRIVDDTGELPQVSKTQAKELTINMCRLIDTSFEEGVRVRQWPNR
jgi:hypothetical protein